MQFIKRRARNFLTYPSFQLLMVVANTLITALTCVLVAVLMQTSAEILAVGVIVLAILCSAVVNIVLSHRVAGPIMRTRTYLEGVRRYFSVGHPTEEIPDLKFREGDFFADLPDKINGALQACARYSAEQKKDSREN